MKNSHITSKVIIVKANKVIVYDDFFLFNDIIKLFYFVKYLLFFVF